MAAAGVGTVFGILALGDKSDYNDHATSQKADDGENHALIADMGFCLAITLGVTSAVLFLTKDEAQTTGSALPNHTVASARKSTPIRIIPTPVITPTGGGAGALVRF